MSLGAALLVASSAHAQVFKITPGTPGAVLSTEAALEAFLSELEDEVNAGLPSVETGEYTKGMANASAMATSGTAVVYGTPFSFGLIGANLSAGIDLGEGNKLSDFDAEKAAGFGAQAGIILGFNPGSIMSSPIGFIDPTRMQLFLSYFAQKRTLDTADVDFASFGVTAKYRLFDARNLATSLVKWNGLDVLGGIRYNKMKGSFTKEFDTEFTGTGGVTATVAGPAVIGADVKVISIPVEASTSLRLAYFLNLIGGAALDFNFGSSTANGDYDSDIDFTDGSTATGDLELGGKASPTLLNARAFIGTGIDFAVGSLNFTLGKSLTASAWNVNTMLSLYW